MSKDPRTVTLASGAEAGMKGFQTWSGRDLASMQYFGRGLAEGIRGRVRGLI